MSIGLLMLAALDKRGYTTGGSGRACAPHRQVRPLMSHKTTAIVCFACVPIWLFLGLVGFARSYGYAIAAICLAAGIASLLRHRRQVAAPLPPSGKES